MAWERSDTLTLSIMLDLLPSNGPLSSLVVVLHVGSIPLSGRTKISIHKNINYGIQKLLDIFTDNRLLESDPGATTRPAFVPLLKCSVYRNPYKDEKFALRTHIPNSICIPF